MQRSERVTILLALALAGCREERDVFAPFDVSEVKCNTHRDAAGLPACIHALESFLANRTDRIVQVVAADDGGDTTERLFVVHTRSDPRWPAASDMIVAPLSEPIDDKRLIVITLRKGKGHGLYVVRPLRREDRARE